MANEALCMMLWYYIMCTYYILDRALVPDVNNREFRPNYVMISLNSCYHADQHVHTGHILCIWQQCHLKTGFNPPPKNCTLNATKPPSVKDIYQKWWLLILLKYQQIFNFIAPRLRKITRPFLKHLYWSKYLIYKWRGLGSSSVSH